MEDETGSNHLLPRTCPVLDGVGGLEFQLLAHSQGSVVRVTYDTGCYDALLTTLLVVGFGVIVLGSLLGIVGRSIVGIDCMDVGCVDFTTLHT